MKITVYHNEDAGFSQPYKPGHRLERVHQTEVDFVPSGHPDVLNALYQEYNIGEGREAQAYRGVKIVDGMQVDDGQGKAIVGHDGQVYGIRSLSVGDVLVLDGKAYTVARFGFEEVDLEVTP